MVILVMDPGNSTGWVSESSGGNLIGGTIFEDLRLIRKLVLDINPDVLVFEKFNLYPGMGKHMTNNEFYPCQVIGVLKEVAVTQHIPYLFPLAASVKKFAGDLDERWRELCTRYERTEHMKDAYLLLKYFKRIYEGQPKMLSKGKTPVTL